MKRIENRYFENVVSVIIADRRNVVGRPDQIVQRFHRDRELSHAVYLNRAIRINENSVFVVFVTKWRCCVIEHTNRYFIAIV